ncbi:MAG: dihydrodipicolinate synthase family protein [Planctomycetaceae bacterium]|nr:dihydrodipicolinate synthase family protein [Planctomycetaceae bacterium]
MPILYHGVWPTMVTPFTAADKPDYPAIRNMVEWYIENGCDGIFAVCQSSEMFFLSLAEKRDIAACVVDSVGGRIAVVVSGHTADSLDEQKAEIESMARVRADAYVLVSNRLAREDEGEAVFVKNASALFKTFPDIQFGMYECPYPYKRLVTTEFLLECARGKRLSFFKDTCCDPDRIRERAAALGAPSSLALFNANAATILESLIAGYAGYNGVMANYHPRLYAWLVANFALQPVKSRKLADLLTVLALSEARCYPITAKYHFNKCAVPMSLNSRGADVAGFTINDRLGMDALIAVEEMAWEYLGLS